MKQFLTVLLLLLGMSAYAQIPADKEQKKQAFSKSWSIIKYETFGVATPPPAGQENDKIVLGADMTFTIVEKGKEYKGKWNFMSPEEYINCKSTTGNFNKIYRLISVSEKEAVIEYKDPDLVKTRYYLVVR